MEWIFLEIFIALAIGIAIVWWTVAPNKKRDANRDATKKVDPQEKKD